MRSPTVLARRSNRAGAGRYCGLRRRRGGGVRRDEHLRAEPRGGDLGLQRAGCRAAAIVPARVRASFMQPLSKEKPEHTAIIRNYSVSEISRFQIPARVRSTSLVIIECEQYSRNDLPKLKNIHEGSRRCTSNDVLSSKFFSERSARESEFQ